MNDETNARNDFRKGVLSLISLASLVPMVSGGILLGGIGGCMIVFGLAGFLYACVGEIVRAIETGERGARR